VQLESRQLAHVLDVWPVARLATIGAGGAPHLVPIVFASIDDYLYSPIDAKPKGSADLQRLRNVAQDGRVCLLLDHYASQWRQLWWIRIDATAERVGRIGLTDAEFARATERLRHKYPQYRSIPLFRGEPQLLRIQPRAHTAWSAEPIEWEALR